MIHAHKFILVPATNTMTWKCMNCKWFVHLGLAHVMIGKDAICWECEGIFKMTELAMREAKPRCDDCRIGSVDDVEKFLELQRKKKLATEKDEPTSEE